MLVYFRLQGAVKHRLVDDLFRKKEVLELLSDLFFVVRPQLPEVCVIRLFE